jgi:hypothetical protein
MIGRSLLWVATVAISIIAGWQSMGQIEFSGNPSLSAMAWPSNGHAMAGAADALLKQAVLDNNNTLPEAYPAEAVALAQRAFELEPTSVAAVRMLALDIEREAGRAQASRIMRLLPQLSKRDRITNLWLVDDYGRDRNVPEVLEKYDWTLRTSRSAQEFLFPLMTTTLADAEYIAPYRDLLGRNPPWLADFWQRLVRKEAALSNAATLRRELGKGASPILAEQDAELVARLIQRGKFDEALALRKALATGTTGPGQFIINGDFANQPYLAPLDWELISNGEYGAAVDTGQGQMIVSAVPDSSGVAARQLISVSPGTYQLVARLAQNKLASTELRIDVRCAQAARATNRVASLPITSKNNALRMTLGSGGCRFFWIEWVVAIPGGAPFDDAVVDGITLQHEQ